MLARKEISAFSIDSDGCVYNDNYHYSYSKHRLLEENQSLLTNDIKHTQSWTRDLINAAFSVRGNYYLPYQPFATINQFEIGYPEYNHFLNIKHEYDDSDIFKNEFYLKYLVT